tara:strand:- start:240 stop:740 length:501 start_codon:yes stop_codon:yes gene_type:complete
MANMTKQQFEAQRANEMRANFYKSIIRQDEGLRLKPYKAQKDEKYFTIGYGRYGKEVEAMGTITKERAEELLDEDVKKRMKTITQYLPDFYTYPLDLQGAIFSEHYRGSIAQSPKTTKLITQGLFSEAGEEFLNNEQYKNRVELGVPGIGPRMERVVRFLNKYVAK